MTTNADINKTIVQPASFPKLSEEVVSYSNGGQCSKPSIADSLFLNSLSEILMSMFASRMVYYHTQPDAYLLRSHLYTDDSNSLDSTAFDEFISNMDSK
jgi:hypothetical protein